MAGVTRSDEMTFGGDLEPITAHQGTHDPLWIVSGDGVVIALLEKDGPKRESILAAFRERLESRWLGDQLAAGDAAMRFLRAPSLPGRGGISKLAILAIAMMLLIFVLALVVSKLAH